MVYVISKNNKPLMPCRNAIARLLLKQGKAKVLNRDNYICQQCKGKKKDSKLEVHHIIFRNHGGSEEEENLITLCSTCYYDLHHGKIKLKNAGRVRYLGGKYFIKGRMSSGYAILMDMKGNKVDFSCMPKGVKTPKLSNCKRVGQESHG